MTMRDKTSVPGPCLSLPGAKWDRMRERFRLISDELSSEKIELLRSSGELNEILASAIGRKTPISDATVDAVIEYAAPWPRE